jgi:hypothetical protein
MFVTATEDVVKRKELWGGNIAAPGALALATVGFDKLIPDVTSFIGLSATAAAELVLTG